MKPFTTVFLIGIFCIVCLNHRVDSFNIFRILHSQQQQQPPPLPPPPPGPPSPPPSPPSNPPPSSDGSGPSIGTPQITSFNGSIADFLQQTQSNFSILNRLINETGIPLNSTNVALFAPNDQAFMHLPSWISGMVNQSVANSTALPAFQALMLYHIHPGSDFTPQNITGGSTGSSDVGCMHYMWANESGSSGNATSLSTAMRPLNLTIYTVQHTQQQQQQNQSNATWWVNDAQILSVTNTSTGYVYELSRFVTPMYYFNSSIYDVQQPPPQLGSNYTFPKAPSSPPTVNLTNVVGTENSEERRMEEARIISEAFGF